MIRLLYCLAILLTIKNYSWSQGIDGRIADVENGLTMQTIVPDGAIAIKGNILDKMRQYSIPGISVAVIHNGNIDWSKSYGIADLQTKDSVTNETLFQLASIGKVITALAALHLVKQGQLSLDENVNDKLKRWKIPENQLTVKDKVTLRHLLSHSSGLADDYGFQGYAPDSQIPGLLQIINCERPANTKKLLHIKTKPGQTERYSGGGYLIIQLLIEDVTGTDFSEFVNNVIFKPLGMSNTTYDYRPDVNQKAKIASGNRGTGRPLRNKRYHIYPERGAAGPWSTASDIAKLVIELQKEYYNESELILNKNLVSGMFSPQINNKGLGVNLKGLAHPEAFWHAGQNLGYTGLFYGLINQRDGAVILLNSDGGTKLMQEFMTSVAHAYDWPVMKSARALPISDELQLKLIGNYRDPATDKVLIVENIKSRLKVKTSNSRTTYDLFRIDDNIYTFRNGQDYYRISFNLTGQKVDSLIYTQSIGKEIRMIKTAQYLTD